MRRDEKRNDPLAGLLSVVSGSDPSSRPDVGDVNERLRDGIETCRSVIANYRSLLTEDLSGGAASSTSPMQDHEAPDESG